MDINEKKGTDFHRHPWELSRTKSVMKELLHFIDNDKVSKYLNIGAGDLYFDECWGNMHGQKHRVYAVDIGYIKEEKCNNIYKYRTLESVNEANFDYAIMMDSLEYMTDDISYIKSLTNKIIDGGKIILTLPAYSSLYSKHDEIVGNLRRYSFSDFKKCIRSIDGLIIEDWHYFYFSLLCVRFIQKLFKYNIDTSHKVTTGWKYSEKSPLTSIVTCVLNIDYQLYLLQLI